MATITKFEQLQIWQKARTLSAVVYQLTNRSAFGGDVDLARQIRRSSGSVMDNIAEGFGRGSRGEFAYFLGIAKGSAEEVKSQLYRSLDNGYIIQQEFDNYYELGDEICRMISGFIKHLNNTPHKGQRHQRVAEVEIVYERLANFDESDSFESLEFG